MTEIPDQLRQEMETFGKQFQAWLVAGNTNDARAAFDRVAIVDAILEGVQGNQQRVNEFKIGLGRGIQIGIGSLLSMWSGQDIKFKHVTHYQGQPAVRFRVISQNAGISLVDLVLHRGTVGKLQVINFCNHALGYEMVAQARQTAAPVLAELDRSFLERLLQQPNLTFGDVEKYGELSKKFAARDFAGVEATYQSLAPTLRDTLSAVAMRIGALQQSGNDEAYKRTLKEAAVKFKSANFQFMLLDAYFIEKQYDKAIACVDAFMQTLETDAALLTLKSGMLNLKGDVPAAREVLRRAMELEPDCLYAHSKGLDVLLAAKDWPAVRNSMVLLEEKGGYQFKGGLRSPLWDEFKKQPESLPWR